MNKSLPLVHLSLLRPILAGLRDRGVDPEAVLNSAGLTEEAVFRDDASVHVMVIHEFLELAADAAGDPTFCACIGQSFEPDGWPMIVRAVDQACSLAEFLSIYVSGSNAVSSSVTAYLEVRGQTAVFGETRLFRPTLKPAQNDGFMVGLSLSMLQRAMGARMDPSQMSLVVCEPEALPTSMAAFQALRGDDMGFRIQFPSVWLAHSVGRHEKPTADSFQPVDPVELDFLSSFRLLLDQSIMEGVTAAESAASLVSMSQSKLARQLRKHGTTISQEIENAKLKYSESVLASDTISIEELALQLQYSDASNFARWFKKRKGEAPSMFRLRKQAERAQKEGQTG